VTLERINELTPRQAIVGFCALMTLWIVAFARTEVALPAVLVLVLLLLPAIVSFGLGYVVADWKALYFAAVPVVVAAVVGGLPSALWAAVVLLTAFPGAPLIAAGVYVREWLERRDPAYVDPWLI
jgi:ABC-type multidrug transport system permease subunit